MESSGAEIAWKVVGLLWICLWKKIEYVKKFWYFISARDSFLHFSVTPVYVSVVQRIITTLWPVWMMNVNIKSVHTCTVHSVRKQMLTKTQSSFVHTTESNMWIKDLTLQVGWSYLEWISESVISRVNPVGCLFWVNLERRCLLPSVPQFSICTLVANTVRRCSTRIFGYLWSVRYDVESLV